MGCMNVPLPMPPLPTRQGHCMQVYLPAKFGCSSPFKTDNVTNEGAIINNGRYGP